MNKLTGLLGKFVGFIKGALSETDGQGSYTRVSGFLIALASVCWVSYLVVRNHELPDLAGVALLVGGGSGTQYAINKTEDIVKAFKGTPEDPKPGQ